MASTIAALNIMVNANTGSAIGQLSLLDKKLKESLGVANATSTGMTSKLGPKMAAGAGIAAVGVAAVAVTKQLFDLGKEFDSAYDKIRVGTGATGKQLEKLKKDFKAVAKSVPDDFDTVGEAVADLNQRLDLTGRPLRRMTRNMLNLSRITGTDLRGNVKSVARAFQDWDIDAKGQIKTLNGLFRLYQKGGGDVSELADSLQRFGSPLRSLGFKFEEAAAMFATFEKAGVNTQTMVPGLKLALANLTAPTDKLKGSLEALGVAIGKPKQGLQEVMNLLGDKSKLNTAEKINLAMQVFGKRAGADMAEAVRQGRFNVEDFIKVMENGSDTINKTAGDTNDFGENMKIFANKLKVAVEPAATGVFNVLGKISKVLTDPRVDKALKLTRQIFSTTFKVIYNQVLKPFVTLFRESFKVIRSVINATSKFFTQDVTGMWNKVSGKFQSGVKAVKGFVGDMRRGVKSGVSAVRDGMVNIFTGAWDRVEGVFEGGANAVIGVVNKIIDAINLIPGVPDIGKIDSVGSSGPKTKAQKAFKTFQRGSYITGGKPTGDSVPALLERGEYVLNRNAVAKVGVDKLNQLNFKAASRFQQGGPIGLINGGDVWDAAKGAVGKVAGKGAGFFIGKLPKPDIPQPFTGVGPYVIDQVTDWIKGRVKSPTEGPLGGFSGNLAAAMKMAQSHGLTITSTTGGTHAPGSYHYSGRAFDASNGSSPTPEMQSYFMDAAGKWGKSITELFYDPIGWYIKYGSKVPGAIGGHSDHVHTAFQSGGPVGGIARMVRGGQVVKQAAPILARKGFDFKSIAGILGNAYGESNWDTEAMEPGTDNGGLFGFTAYEKSMASLRSYASSRGWKWNDVKTQILFMLASGGMGTKATMNSLDSIPDTTKYFMDDYERPGIPRLDVRTQGGFMAAKIMKGMSLGKSGLEGEAFGGKGRAGFGYAIGGPKPEALAKQHKSGLAKIKRKGLAYPLKDKILGMGGVIGSLMERLGISEQNASAEWGPGGSELTDGEKADQVSLNRQILAKQQEEAKWLNKAIAALYAKETVFTDQMWAAKPKGSPTHWKFGALKKAVKSIRGNIGSLGSIRETLVGVTGQGGELFDTQMRLKNLGVASTVESASVAARDSELVSLMREQLGLANRNNAILSAQMPIYSQFMPKYHTGGVIPGAGEQPIMAMGGEGVFTRDQMAAMGGSAPVITLVIEEGAGIDASKIRAEVNGELTRLVTKQRTGNYGPKYTTAGRA